MANGSPEMRTGVRQFGATLLGVAVVVILGSGTGWSGQEWWQTGRVDGYPKSTYMTALGYGSTLARAQKDAVATLSRQIDSSIRSHYTESSSRSGMTVTRSVRKTLSVHSHAKLYNVQNIRGRFVADQGNFVAVVGVKRDELVRYLQGRIDNLRATVRSDRSDLSGTEDPMRQIRDLSGVIRAKEKAAFFDRERAAVSGGTPSDAFNVQSDIHRIETLLSRHMTVRIDLRNGCGGTDRFVRHVAGSIQQEVADMGLLVVPSGGQVVIGGTVSARPMRGFSQRYRYFVLHFALSMAAADNTVWGAVDREEKVAGVTVGQAELLAVRQVSRQGVRPLLAGLGSKLFLTSDDPGYVAFPSREPGPPAGPSLSPDGHGCDDFGTGEGAAPGLGAGGGRPTQSSGPGEGYARFVFVSYPRHVHVTNQTGVQAFPNGVMGDAPFTIDLPVRKNVDHAVDAGGIVHTRTRYGPMSYFLFYSKGGFVGKSAQIVAMPGRTETVRIVLTKKP